VILILTKNPFFSSWRSVLTLHRTLWLNVNKNPTDATVCRYVFTAKLLYMFRVSQHPSSGVLKTVTATSGTGHTTCTATPLQRGLIGTGLWLLYAQPGLKLKKKICYLLTQCIHTCCMDLRRNIDCFPIQREFSSIQRNPNF